MKREKFLQKLATTSLLIGAGSFPFEAFAKDDFHRLTILHTNDQHSRIEPFPMDGGKWQGLGGFAQRAKLIAEVRAIEKNVLLLDSGDIWQGTPYFNKYGGALEYQLMSEMKYDASTLGNHDFDAGIEGLLKQLPLAQFPFLNVNYDFSDTLLDGKIKRTKIFRCGEVKVGVFGVGIELNGLVPDKLFGAIRYGDPIVAANNAAERLKHDAKCDLVVCLSHLGYSYMDGRLSDIALARSSRDIDLILGGHTHTFFKNVVEEKNEEGRKVLINQVGWAGIVLGRIDFLFEQKRKALTYLNTPLNVAGK